MTSTRLTVQAVLGVLVLMLTGCAVGGATATGAPSTGAVSPTPLPSMTTASPEDEAAMHAEEVVRAYFRAEAQCLTDPPHTPITCFDNVAITTELDNLRNSLVSAQAMATRVSGEIDVVSIDRESVDLTNKVTEQPPTVPQVVFSVCADVSRFNIVDKDGKSIVPADRKPRSRVELHVANYKYPDMTQWRVAYIVVPKDSTC